MAARASLFGRHHLLLRLSSAAATLGLAGVAARTITQQAPTENPNQSSGHRLYTQTATSSDADAIRAIRINVPEVDLSELRRRIHATRWPERETVTDASRGVQLTTIQQLAHYWQTNYDWRNVEAKLNSVPNYLTELNGLDVHFIHVRSQHENALPVIITHGWPGSIIEQLKVVDPLTNPTAHGASAADAFHVVIPSLPGHGFSGKPATTGWDPAHIADTWIQLMRRLGYTRFVAQGGDWGDMVSELMAVHAPPELLGIHVNMPSTVPPDVSRALQAHDPTPSGLSAEESRAYEQLNDFFTNHAGYAAEMATRPQTLYGLADSPVGLAAWMLDHDPRSYELIARAFAGHPGGLKRDDVLDNITLYWLTNTGISAANLYAENKLGFFDVKNVQIPVAASVFPDEIYAAPRSWAERAYPNLIYYNTLDRGGHFAAWERPQVFSEEVRAGLRSLRQAASDQ